MTQSSSTAADSTFYPAPTTHTPPKPYHFTRTIPAHRAQSLNRIYSRRMNTTRKHSTLKRCASILLTAALCSFMPASPTPQEPCSSGCGNNHLPNSDSAHAVSTGTVVESIGIVGTIINMPGHCVLDFIPLPGGLGLYYCKESDPCRPSIQINVTATPGVVGRITGSICGLPTLGELESGSQLILGASKVLSCGDNCGGSVAVDASVVATEEVLLATYTLNMWCWSC